MRGGCRRLVPHLARALRRLPDRSLLLYMRRRHAGALSGGAAHRWGWGALLPSLQGCRRAAADCGGGFHTQGSPFGKREERNRNPPTPEGPGRSPSRGIPADPPVAGGAGSSLLGLRMRPAEPVEESKAVRPLRQDASEPCRFSQTVWPFREASPLPARTLCAGLRGDAGAGGTWSRGKARAAADRVTFRTDAPPTAGHGDRQPRPSAGSLTPTNGGTTWRTRWNVRRFAISWSLTPGRIPRTACGRSAAAVAGVKKPMAA